MMICLSVHKTGHQFYGSLPPVALALRIWVGHTPCHGGDPKTAFQKHRARHDPYKPIPGMVGMEGPLLGAEISPANSGVSECCILWCFLVNKPLTSVSKLIRFKLGKYWP